MPTGCKSVLVIDKEPAICQLLAYALGEHGFTVYTASSVPPALELCRRHRPAVALVEIDFSDAEEDQLLAELKAAAPAMALCVVSASGGSCTGEELRALGVQHFFPKPFTLANLVKTLDQLVDRAQLPPNGQSLPTS